MYNTALSCLRRMFGADAKFRVDQHEAIERMLTNKRLLVVEKTGWGKSIVYFIATKNLGLVGRKQKNGSTSYLIKTDGDNKRLAKWILIK